MLRCIHRSSYEYKAAYVCQLSVVGRQTKQIHTILIGTRFTSPNLYNCHSDVCSDLIFKTKKPELEMCT